MLLATVASIWVLQSQEDTIKIAYSAEPLSMGFAITGILGVAATVLWPKYLYLLLGVKKNKS